MKLEFENGRVKYRHRVQGKARARGGGPASPAEVQFQERAKRKGLEAFRAGWPDFLCLDAKGEAFFVEVKSGCDALRMSQRKMFEALERVGIKVYIWHDRKPWQLTPWRKWRKLRFAKRYRKKSPEESLLELRRELAGTNISLDT